MGCNVNLTKDCFMNEKKEMTMSPVAYISIMLFAIIWALFASSFFTYIAGMFCFMIFSLVFLNMSVNEYKEHFNKYMKEDK